MSLETDLENWDMKSADAIAGIYGRYAKDPAFPGQIVAFMGKVPLQRGTTWLLKHHLEKSGDGVDDNLAEAIYEHAKQLEHWESKLHILQCMSRLPIPNTRVATVEAFLHKCLEDEAKFVRAWAYSGFRELAAQYPKFTMSVTQLLEHALKTETAGSIQARLRRVIKQGFSQTV